jgi:hypothetical protein
MICSCAVQQCHGGVVLGSLGVVNWGSIRSCVVLRCLDYVVLRCLDCVVLQSLGVVLDPLVA